ncbi:hypothetical protein ABZX74_07160 [Streptomyces olivaceoviridis]|uniref:hypothetical protein n=1 Tax=Streptomyces olivaceoviridis TaxID=1921 RepID=UPI0033B6F0EC
MRKSLIKSGFVVGIAVSPLLMSGISGAAVASVQQPATHQVATALQRAPDRPCRYCSHHDRGTQQGNVQQGDRVHQGNVQQGGDVQQGNVQQGGDVQQGNVQQGGDVQQGNVQQGGGADQGNVNVQQGGGADQGNQP